MDKATWTIERDHFVLSGWGKKIQAAVSTRKTGLPQSAYTLADLRRIVENRTGSVQRVIGMEQVHAGEAQVISHLAADTLVPECDALATAHPGVALTLRSADCLPVFIYDPEHHAAGLAHAGWRGIRANVLKQLMESMKASFKTRPSVCQAALGPAIGPCCYEVGPEFESWASAWLKKGGEKRFLDLPKAAADQLAELGLPADHLTHPPCCTSCQIDICHSFRRENAASGRLVSAVILS